MTYGQADELISAIEKGDLAFVFSVAAKLCYQRRTNAHFHDNGDDYVFWDEHQCLFEVCSNLSNEIKSNYQNRKDFRKQVRE